MGALEHRQTVRNEPGGVVHPLRVGENLVDVGVQADVVQLQVLIAF